MEPESEPNIEISGKPYIRLYPASPDGAKWYEPDWPARKETKTKDAGKPRNMDKKQSTRTILKRSEPSKQESFVINAADLFESENRDVLDFGSAIHELLEKIEWCDEETDAERIIMEWTSGTTCGAEIVKDVSTQFRDALKSSEIRQALSRPTANAEVRREWKFDIILNGEWVSGAFDRVLIVRDKSGKPQEATIIDYKSNRIEPTEFHIKRITETYRKQMDMYRQALSMILNLPQDKITLKLLLTRIQKMVELE